jgi:hypothetical protein
LVLDLGDAVIQFGLVVISGRDLIRDVVHDLADICLDRISDRLYLLLVRGNGLAYIQNEGVGILYIDKDEKTYTPAEVTAYYVMNGGAMPGLESQFPDGSDAVRCTHYAIQIGRRFPSHTQIFGFSNEENPDCEFVTHDAHPGGHDFAILDGRWLVDPWVRLVRGLFDEIAFDLEDPADVALVLKRYGKKENWKHMTGAEETIGWNTTKEAA